MHKALYQQHLQGIYCRGARAEVGWPAAGVSVGWPEAETRVEADWPWEVEAEVGRPIGANFSNGFSGLLDKRFVEVEVEWPKSGVELLDGTKVEWPDDGAVVEWPWRVECGSGVALEDGSEMAQ